MSAIWRAERVSGRCEQAGGGSMERRSALRGAAGGSSWYNVARGVSGMATTGLDKLIVSKGLNVKVRLGMANLTEPDERPNADGSRVRRCLSEGEGRF